MIALIASGHLETATLLRSSKICPSRLHTVNIMRAIAAIQMFPDLFQGIGHKRPHILLQLA